VINYLMKHRSARKLKKQAVSEETIEMILRVGTQAVAAGGFSPTRSS